jgi:hypothetical protein
VIGSGFLTEQVQMRSRIYVPGRTSKPIAWSNVNAFSGVGGGYSWNNTNFIRYGEYMPITTSFILQTRVFNNYFNINSYPITKEELI